uniref:Complex 1 LYR protein domain-containing protein n=1 Tax=Bicosoecida sp. CB-2014 TaxID=1486930 RepID=A0A7S1CI62_9STRA|mmetsp:Transcript_27652/g.95635  ORF Transcript_27652/g.95635 Transcript_27652/m.95635 type:complete len:149 (+) Transcript_27652:119-565(+)
MAASASLNLYRRLVRSVRLLPEAKRPGAVSDIRSSWHKHLTATDDETVRALFRKAQSRLDYARATTPRAKWEAAGLGTAESTVEGEEDGSGEGDGVRRYVVDRGQVVDGKAAAKRKAKYSNWNERNVDPDQLARHRHLLERQHFGGRG